MSRNLLLLLAYIGVFAAILKLNSARWKAYRQRRRDRISSKLGEDPLVALMHQVEPLWATDPAKAKQILEGHYKAVRERNAGKSPTASKKATSAG
jgi:hypothetical protein